jgi:ribosomal protein L21E
MYVDFDHKNWNQFLTSVTFAYNSSLQSTTEKSPFAIGYGVEPDVPIDTALMDDIDLEIPRRVLELVQYAPELAADNIRKRQKTDKTRFAKKRCMSSFEVGDKVLVYSPRRYVGKCEKLLHMFYGPYIVTRRTSPVNCEVKRVGKKVKPMVVNVNRMKLFFE